MIWFVVSVLVAMCVIALTVLSGPDMSSYDQPMPDAFPQHPDDIQANERFLKVVRALRKEVIADRSIKRGLASIRKFANELSDDLQTETEFKADNANGVAFEWAIAPDSDPRRRVLFIHGGAFIFGSPKGHRKFSDRFSKILGAAVASVDYRMLPENGRWKSVEDCRTAYQWLLENGPDGPESLDYLAVSGDSAGGNLALMLSSYSKSANLRRPNAVVAFSPSTDMTLSSPTIKAHRQSDKILGEGLGLLGKIPTVLRAWIGLISMRANPASPALSPLFDDLSDLPPTLIHASTNEMLLGEAVRYTNKAKELGSPVTMQIWEQQLHDWHLFNMGSGSSEVAWAEIERFLAHVDAQSLNVKAA